MALEEVKLPTHPHGVMLQSSKLLLNAWEIHGHTDCEGDDGIALSYIIKLFTWYHFVNFVR